MIAKTKEGRPETANLKFAGFKCLLAVKNIKKFAVIVLHS